MALTAAEKQRRYRERKAAATVTLPRDEYEALQQELIDLREAVVELSGKSHGTARAHGAKPRQPQRFVHWLFTIERSVDGALRRQNAVGILDQRYAALRVAYTHALSASFRDGAFPPNGNVTDE